jgi:hypothetical protein
MTSSDFVGITQPGFEYLLSVIAKIQREYVNGDVYPAGQPFLQVVLKEPTVPSGTMYSQWFLDPVVFVVGTQNGPPGLQWTSFFHEMGHNLTLNTLASFYYGGRIDGPANAIYSETMAQIFQHAAGYEVVRRAPELGLGNDAALDIAVSLWGSMNFLKSQYDAYVAGGKTYDSWNDAGTQDDQAVFGTFMVLGYVVLREAELRDLGYRGPVQRMLEFLQLWNLQWQTLFSQSSNSDAAETFRSTLMVAAISHGLQDDLRPMFQALNFPVDSTTWNNLTGANLTGVPFSPPSGVAGSQGGTGSIEIQLSSGTLWTATSDSPWLVIESGSAGNGTRTLQWRVAVNTTGQERTGHIRIGQTTIQVVQAAFPTPSGVGTYSAGLWKLDGNGNGVFDAGVDQSFDWDWAETTPVYGDWNGDSKDEIGIYINGFWFLDMDGNGIWDGESTDKAYLFGQAGDMPIIGRW